MWAKVQPQGASAVLVINQQGRVLTHSIELSKLNLTAAGAYEVRDIWARRTLPGKVTGGMLAVRVQPYDSAFLLVSPSSIAAHSLS